MPVKESIIDISGKSVVLTGSTGYLGSSIADTLLKAGAKVILLARNCEKLDEQIHKSKKLYGKNKVDGHAVDFYDKDAFEKKLKSIVLQCDIDVLINNAYDLSEIG